VTNKSVVFVSLCFAGQHLFVVAKMRTLIDGQYQVLLCSCGCRWGECNGVLRHRKGTEDWRSFVRLFKV